MLVCCRHPTGKLIIFFPTNVKPETVDLINIVCVAACTTLSEIGSYMTTLTMVKSKKLNMTFPVENMIPLAGTGGFASQGT